MITLGMAAIAVAIAEVATAAILAATAASGDQSPIAGDPGLYNLIATAILEGGIPYLDVPIEHLPGALLPMLFTKGLAVVAGLEFETLWPVIMGMVFIATIAVAEGIPSLRNPGRRYLVMSLPLLPLILFRVEPWLMLWVVASVVLAFRRIWPAQALTTIVASLVKGWPILLFALPYRLSKRPLALLAGFATLIALLAIAVLPGFREGRAFDGIHTETVIGSIVLVFRGLTGTDLGLIGTAGATYVDVPLAATLLNALIGVPFLVVSVIGVFRTDEPAQLMRALGLAVIGIILASPLFSAQFLYWLVPFVILLVAKRQGLYFLASCITLVTVILWAPFSTSWSIMVLVRNILLVVLAVGWTRDTLFTGRITRETNR
jgi:hypothetical protein